MASPDSIILCRIDVFEGKVHAALDLIEHQSVSANFAWIGNYQYEIVLQSRISQGPGQEARISVE